MTSNKKSYVSWGLDCEDVYDDEGDVVDTCEYVLIDLVYVAPHERGQGLAEKLLKDALVEIEAKHPGVAVRLVVQPKEDGVDIDGLVRLYERCGFCYESDAGAWPVMSL